MKKLAELTSAPSLRAAGLMSGTSADGVDAAIVDLTPRRVKLLAFGTFAYSPSLRKAVMKASHLETARLDDICHLNFALGETFASALVELADRSGISLSSIDLVGSHGQTICHIPNGRRFGRRRIKSTLQIAEPCVIAERTGITTVADFRPRDIAAGGEGAPLVPHADYVLFSHKRLSRAVQNIGGIANVTFLPAACDPSDIIAFDAGPGNMVIDDFVRRATNGRNRFDRGGKMAASGNVDAPLLSEMKKHPFLGRRPPKSTGREQFGAGFCDGLWRRARRRRLPASDIVATATAFTAHTIADAYKRFLPCAPDEVILCGGGSRNRTLVGMIAHLVAFARVTSTDEFGIDADAKEAVSFAILAAETIRGTAANVPSATGARKPVILGKVVPA